MATYTSAQLLRNSAAGPPNETGTLTVVSATRLPTTTGTLTFDAATGSVTYRAAAGFVGLDQFQITISDGELTTTGTVSLDVREFEPSTVNGSVFFDYIRSISNPVRNGTQEAGEPGLQMARVHLMSSAANNATGEAINASLYTDVDGKFEFDNVPPGTYQLKFDLPIMVFDGADVPGAFGDSDSVSNQFTFTIDEPGGFDASDYNFTLQGLSGRAGNVLDLLVSSYMAANPGLSRETQRGLTGAKVAIDATGMQQWFTSRAGFEDVRYGEINVDANGTVATLTVVMDDGSLRTGIIPENRRMITKNPGGGFVVQIFGSVDSFGLQPDGSLNDGDLGLLRYQEAIDILLTQDGDVL